MPAETVRTVSVVLPAVTAIVLFVIEAVRPWSDIVLVRVIGPAKECKLVTLRVELPDES